MKNTNKKINISKIFNLIISTAIIIFIIYFFINYKMYIVVSGSMEPTLKTNELILIKKTNNTTTFSEGEIISFFDESFEIPITHRIIKIENNLIYTKGDYNNIVDFTPIKENQIIGKLVWHSYYLGLLYVKYKYELLILGILAIIVLNLLLYNKDNKKSKQDKKRNNLEIIYPKFDR